jgi:hypothetical protein
MLKLADLRKTTRRANGDGMRIVHPRFLRDRSLAPRIDMAVRYLESMLGRPRRELDQEVIVQLFGDHKIARCIVACLSSTYRHRPRAFVEVVPPTQAEALAAHNLHSPSDLRLWLFRRANAELPGFVGAAERPPFLRAAADTLQLTMEQIETLLTLDAPEQAILVRNGPVPTADDVIARFNYETTAALLANASLMRLTLSRSPADAEALRALCVEAGVRAELSGREMVLHGQQDAMNGWMRHGARLVRLLSVLLVCGLPARSGEAIVAAPTDEWRFRLDAEVLGFLGSNATQPPAFDSATVLESWQGMAAFAADFAALRRAGNADGWTLRRAAEPVVLASAVVPALFICSRGAQRVPLVPAPIADVGKQHLTSVSNRLPLVALRLHEHTEEQQPRVHGTLTLSHAGRPDAAALPSLLARALGEVERRTDASRLEAVIDEVRTAGVLTEQQLAERLHCGEEEVWARLALPAARAARRAQDIHYVEGFGLCTSEMLRKAQEAAAEVARLHDDSQVGRAWILRVLGRRLRQVTGASEGIECLIAYLGAA